MAQAKPTFQLNIRSNENFFRGNFTVPADFTSEGLHSMLSRTKEVWEKGSDSKAPELPKVFEVTKRIRMGDDYDYDVELTVPYKDCLSKYLKNSEDRVAFEFNSQFWNCNVALEEINPKSLSACEEYPPQCSGFPTDEMIKKL